MSHIDTFDYKPGLVAAHGKSLQSDTKPDVFFGQVGRLRRPDWGFHRRGASGLWISELFPNLAQVADVWTIVGAMVAETSNPTPAAFHENRGCRLSGVPSRGAWLSYGLRERGRRSSRVRRDLRTCPGPPAGGLDRTGPTWLPPRPAPGGRHPSSRRADRRPVPIAAARRRGRVRRASARDRDEPPALRRSCRRRGPRRPHPGLRAGRTDAGFHPGGRRPRGGIDRDDRPVRSGAARDPRFRPRLPDRAEVARARRPVRPALLRRHVRQPPTELGWPRGHEGQPRPGGRRVDHPPGRRIAPATSAVAACSTTPSSSSPPSSAAPPSPNPPPKSSARAATTTSTASPSGSPARASSMGSHTGRPTRSAGRRPTTQSPGRTSTPPCCGYSGSITPA